jgi:ATP-dependent helicase/nuclease subunit A
MMLADEHARRRIRDDLDTTLVVEAAAGTGKTTALVSRIVALVSSGRATLRGLVAVTYTEKAAGEMKLRLRTEIERARNGVEPGDPRRHRLDEALAELEVAHVGTIHSFCGDLLRERPVEARIDPSFEILAGDVQASLFSQAFDRWFQRILAAPPEGVRRVLRRQDWEGPRKLLRDAGWKLVELRAFEAPWRREPLDRARVLDAAVARLDQLVQLDAQATDQDDWLAKGIAALARWKQELDRLERLRGRDHDSLEAGLRLFANPNRTRAWTWRGSPRRQPFGVAATRDEAIALRDEIKGDIDRAVALCDADLAACLRRDLQGLIAEYEAVKVAGSKLDFTDLLLKARDLIRDVAEVRTELQARFSHLLVDEFQDTDPIQAEILLLLGASDAHETDWRRATPAPGKLFVVGDPKQSIYRFRHADLALYQSIKQRLTAHGAAVVHLSSNFRGVPALLEPVNAAFSQAMGEDRSRFQAEHAALAPVRASIDGQPGLIALPIPAPYKKDWHEFASKPEIEASNADAIAAFIDWLVRQSGWKVSDPQAGLVPVEARHVCLLFRRMQSYGKETTRDVIRALEARGLPHVLVGGRGYGDREEVEAIRNALTAIEWPDDDFSVYATLRGPLFSFSDAELLVWRTQAGSLHPFAPQVAFVGGELSAALGLLARLHRGRNRSPIGDTIMQLLGATRAHAGFAIWPNGEQALANVLRVVDLARRYEVGGASSFRGFVERLREQAERSEAADAPVMEDGSEGVRIMTVHKSKGLEFPVVVLADPTVEHTGRPSQHIDPERGLCVVPLAGCVPIELQERAEEVIARDLAESIRLTYVAATRARDLLVVPVVGDQRLPGWVDVLHATLYPAATTARRPQPAPGCPPFGDDSLFLRPGRASLNDAVAPGLHRPERGEHSVVWWDPNRLDLHRDDQTGLRQEEILKNDEQGGAADSSIRAHDQWQAHRSGVIAGGVRPTLLSRTVTEQAALSPPAGADATPVTIERVEGDRARPHGTRFGSLVHLSLAEIDFDTQGPMVARMVALKGRYLGCSSEEIEAAARTIAAALRHPLLRRAAAAAQRGQCQRELPLGLRLDDGVVVDGVTDLAFIDESGTWTVVDFKTDLGVNKAGGAEHEAQVRLYARAIESATARPARPYLLYV